MLSLIGGEDMAGQTADVVIIGSGVAGLMTAHLLADDLNVILITKSKVSKSNSSWAQGGMAASLGKDDTWQQHFVDTLKAGRIIIMNSMLNI